MMVTVSGGEYAGRELLDVWPRGDMYRLLCMVQAPTAARLLAGSKGLQRDLEDPLALMRSNSLTKEEEPQKHEHALEAQQAMAALELALAEASQVTPPMSKAEEAEVVGPLPTWQGAWEELRTMEAALHTEMRYIYGPDWEVKPGKCVSKKGTWLKRTTQFSWEVKEAHKLYIPPGVVMPVLQIGQVTDQVEIKRHEWGGQHLRVWLKPPIVRSLEQRRGTWFVYWPHWEDDGLQIVAAADTWLKRTTQMSGELQPFELIYVPRGMAIKLAREPEAVDEQWEKARHAHVHQHRKVILGAAPLTVKQDKYDIFVGHAEDRLYSMRR